MGSVIQGHAADGNDIPASLFGSISVDTTRNLHYVKVSRSKSKSITLAYCGSRETLLNRDVGKSPSRGTDLATLSDNLAGGSRSGHTQFEPLSTGQ